MHKFRENGMVQGKGSKMHIEIDFIRGVKRFASRYSVYGEKLVAYAAQV